MKKEDLTQEQINAILETVMPVLMQQGLKGTTMDSLASSLQMSKRTLYEIFGSKEDMFREAHRYYHKKISESLKKIFESSSNIMEAIINCFLFNRDIMSRLNVDFIRDLEQLACRDTQKSTEKRRHHYQNFCEVLDRGVKEGYFREDVNLAVQCRMLIIQMESLKRTEELFPEDITLIDVFDSITMGFLRGISTEKGLIEIERCMPLLSKK